MIRSNYNRDELIHYKEDDSGLFSLLNLLHIECNNNNIILHGFFCKHNNLIKDGYSITNSQHTNIIYTEGEIFRLDNLEKKQFNNRQYAKKNKGESNLYFIGSSTTYQPFIKYDNSLHKCIVDINPNIKMSESIGFPHRFGERVAIIEIIHKIRSNRVKKGDHIVFIRDGGFEEHESLIRNVSLDKKEITFKKESFFFDNEGHFSEKGIDYLLKKINKNIIEKKQNNKNTIKKDISLAEETMLKIKNIIKEKSNEFDNSFISFQKYLRENKKITNKKVGSILVNCNPITLGHQFLINTASKKLDHLYLFVIESESSEFSFEDRFNMVKSNYRKNKKVTILKGGKFMCSEFIIPEYFNKDTHETSKHVKGLEFESFCFGKKIAPILNIKEIWLGEEPNCKLTHYYNMFMTETMPEYGIKVNIIKRKNALGQAISASSVRELIKQGEAKKIKKLVSYSTFSYLQNNGTIPIKTTILQKIVERIRNRTKD